MALDQYSIKWDAVFPVGEVSQAVPKQMYGGIYCRFSGQTRSFEISQQLKLAKRKSISFYCIFIT